MNFKIPLIISFTLIVLGLSIMGVFGFAIANSGGLKCNIYDLKDFLYSLDRIFDEAINQALFYGREIYRSLK